VEQVPHPYLAGVLRRYRTYLGVICRYRTRTPYFVVRPLLRSSLYCTTYRSVDSLSVPEGANYHSKVPGALTTYQATACLKASRLSVCRLIAFANERQELGFN
jgi:hypothetical protein